MNEYRLNKRRTFVCLIMATLLINYYGHAHGQPVVSDIQHPVEQFRSMLDRYCVSCHNQTLKTAGLMLDTANVARVSEDAQLWERVLTKLSLRAMPPVGMPLRPNDSEYRALLDYLQTQLDSHAQANWNPGRPPIHRLNRNEYTNALRDLLNMEIDAAALLPPDNVGEGFDNNAEVLMLSPLLMERYMFAASKISRLAVGSSTTEPVSETYTVSDDFLQRQRMSEDLPFGSRGGASLQHYFPLDGEYTISVTLQRSLQGFIRGLRKQHTLDIRMDHKRIGTIKVGGEVHGRSGPLWTNYMDLRFNGDMEQLGYEYSADDALQIRFPAKAGTHLVGVTFVEKGTKSTGIKQPELTLLDTISYKGGEPGVETVIITGPYQSSGPGQTASREKIFVCRPLPAATDKEQESCARTILSRLARQAYRRPLTSDDMDYLLGYYRAGQGNEGFESGIELALQSILAGPDFLFRMEKDPHDAIAGEVYPLSDIELASRLSFFLWSTVPDEELLKLAEQGHLREPGILEQQVQRMMKDLRFQQFIDNFGGQWLAVRDVDLVAPNLDIFPDFDDELRIAFKQELKLWFESMVREDRSVVELLTSDYTYVNERLAHHYGIPDVNGSRYRRITVDRPERRGLLGKGGILLATAYNNRTSPVLRGKWVLENLLDMPPPPPPDNVPALATDDEAGKTLTLKQAMERHRANPVCSSCHKLMDPIGFALENFDAIGSFRTRYAEADAEVDASGVLFDGNTFSNTKEFQDVFMQHSERVVHTVTGKLLTYALGRAVEHYDQPAIRQIVNRIAMQNYTWSSLILEVTRSMPFQYRSAR